MAENTEVKGFNEYQEFTKSLAVYNENVFYHVGDNLYHAPWTYPVQAIAEEAGEVNGKVAKFIRKHGTDRDALAKDVAKELGDCLFQISEAARQFGFTLQEIADMNVEKLTDRKERGVLVGEGDER
jgi:NTP pyrophosphatase (non-canonical NTP hydrolase)